MAMDWLMSGGEITMGIALFLGLVFLVAVLRPRPGTLDPRAIVRFPAAHIVVGLSRTVGFAFAVALIAIGITSLY
jgi:hypothetical protein